MPNEELLELINSYSDEKIQSIESVNKDNPDKVIVVGISNIIKRIEFTMTSEGDFSYKFLGIKLRNVLDN